MRVHRVKISPPDPPLTDGVVTLRPWTERDVRAIAAACRDPEIAQWIDDVPVPYRDADARAYVAVSRRGWKESSLAAFAVTDAVSGEVLGSCGVHWHDHQQGVAEIGYWVKRAARGRGVATRAVRLVSRWAIEVCGVQRLQLRADARNQASLRVAERAGFQREGVLRSSRWSERQRRRVDFVIFSLLPSELAAREETVTIS
jgi:RimJ/RimL family protein N-acetyltransferase